MEINNYRYIRLIDSTPHRAVEMRNYDLFKWTNY